MFQKTFFAKKAFGFESQTLKAIFLKVFERPTSSDQKYPNCSVLHANVLALRIICRLIPQKTVLSIGFFIDSVVSAMKQIGR